MTAAVTLALAWVNLPASKSTKLHSEGRGDLSRRFRGSLVHLRGELIGINTAFLGAGRTAPVMDLAIPIDMVGPKRAVHLARFLLQYDGHGAVAGQAALR